MPSAKLFPFGKISHFHRQNRAIEAALTMQKLPWFRFCQVTRPGSVHHVPVARPPGGIANRHRTLPGAWRQNGRCKELQRSEVGSKFLPWLREKPILTHTRLFWKKTHNSLFFILACTWTMVLIEEVSVDAWQVNRGCGRPDYRGENNVISAHWLS